MVFRGAELEHDNFEVIRGQSHVFFNFWNVDTPKSENAEKTDQADQIVQTDHPSDWSCN